MSRSADVAEVRVVPLAKDRPSRTAGVYARRRTQRGVTNFSSEVASRVARLLWTRVSARSIPADRTVK